MTGVCGVFLLLLTLVSAVHLQERFQRRKQLQLLEEQSQQKTIGSLLLSEDCNTAGTRNGGAVALGGVCSFNGNAQYDDLGAFTINGNSATFLTWISWSAFRSWSRVFDCGWILASNTNTDGGIYLEGLGWVQIPNAVQLNQWVLVIGVMNAQTLTQTLYVNDGTHTASATGTYPTIVGCRLGISNWDVDQGFSGLIDQFAVISGAFTAADVQTVRSVAITGLSYAPSSVQAGLSAAIQIVPTVSYGGSYGGGTTYTVNPALPAGLTLNTLTGVISGSSSVNSASTTYTITGTNAGGYASAAVTIAISNAGLPVAFSWDGTADGAGALSQMVVYYSAAGIVGLQTTFGGLVSSLAGTQGPTSQTLVMTPGDFISQVTTWSSGSLITGLKFQTYSGKVWGPFGVSVGNGDLQTVAGSALVKISGTYTSAGLTYPLSFQWSTGPTGTVPFGTFTAPNYEISTPRASCSMGAAYTHVQTITFFLYQGGKVPNYVCGLQISAGGVPSRIVGAFTWPAANIVTQSISVPAGDILNRFDVVECTLAPGFQELCGVTITSLKGVVWTVGTTQAQAVAAGAFNDIVPLNYGQNAPACVFRGFYGTLQMVTAGGSTFPTIYTNLQE